MIQLSETEARVRLKEMTQADVEPRLDDSQIAVLLTQAKRIDVDGITPSESDWTPTWDLNAAAAEGWHRKAGKVAGRFNVTLDGETLQRSQMFANCLKMAERYARRVAGSVSLAAPPGEEASVIGNL